jgi:hypothetical protein
MPTHHSNLSKLALSLIAASTLCLASLTGCGGDGDDDSDSPNYSGAARVIVRNSPARIDTGDRTKVRINISNINENGIMLKILYPDGLRFVPNSAELVLDSDPENEDELTPAHNVEGDDGMFLIFYLSEDDLDQENGVLSFELEGISSVREGKIEVDADVNDPLIDDATEFNAQDPEFLSESESSIEVIE